jgi:hypothetical protein
MTSNHPLRRLLARVCSAGTMSRVVDPIFADMRWEDGRLSWRGCVALFKALALHAVLSLPRRGAMLWTEDNYAIPRTAAFVMLGAVVAAALISIPPMVRVATATKPIRPFWVFFWIAAPQALAMTLPPALIMAIPLVLRRRQISVRLVRRTLLLLLPFVALMCGLLSHPTLEASDTPQGVRIYYPDGRQLTLRREPSETVWAARRHQIHDLRQMNDPQTLARFEWLYQFKVAHAAAAIPFGLGGLAICFFPFGRRHPLLTGVAWIIVYGFLMTVMQKEAWKYISVGRSNAVVLCAWMPNLIVLIAASAVLVSRRSPIRPLSA